MAEAGDAIGESPVRVVLICRVRLYSGAIAELLKRAPGIGCVTIANPDDDIVAAVDTALADVVLLGTGNPGALSVARRLVDARPETRVLGFGVDEVPADVVACAKAGLWGYVPNSASMKDLVVAAQRVARGDTVCSAAMADGLFRHLRGGSASSADAELTQRQRQIARLISEGLSNKQIAGRLSLGTCTVKNHVHDILSRVQVTCRTEAAARFRHISHIS